VTAQVAAEPTKADEDQPLVERARQGDLPAFGELVERYQHRIVNVARAMVSKPEDAEDVAQETFLRAFQGLKGFRGSSSFKTWLYRIATNTAKTHLARRRDRHEDMAGDDTFEHIAAGDDIEQGVVDRNRLDRALAALPVEFREVLILRDVEGLDYREISAALDVPIGTVESRLFRGRQRLRATLMGKGD
jgi:RNA polymerase sigma-70 factor (ECF subfamily)